MTRTIPRAISTVAIAVLGVACAEFPSQLQSNNLGPASAAFSTVPLGFSDVTSSFAADGDAGASLWLPGPRSVAFGIGSNMMGGGMGGAFTGGVTFARGAGHHGPFDGGLTCSGTFNATTGRFVCDPVIRNGLTTERSARYTTASGTVQQAFDTATTNTVNVLTSVTGTVTYTRDTTSGDRRGHHRHHGPIVGDTTTILTATTTVRHNSDRTVSGLAQGSTKRTVEGASSGQENTTGTSSRGAFTATRTVADTTRGLTIPVQGDSVTYPTAGTVIRVMNASVTYAGQAAATSSRREVVTYDGTSSAKVTITQDGVTKNCTLPLPRGRLVCG